MYSIWVTPEELGNAVIVISNMMLQSIGRGVKASVLASARNGLFYNVGFGVEGFSAGLLLLMNFFCTQAVFPLTFTLHQEAVS